MKLKQYERYQINFFGKWVTASGGLIGLSIFLRILHFFGIHMITDFDTGVIVLRLAVPVVFSALFIFLLNGIHWNAPGVYGILGVVFCLLLIIWNFSSGDVLRIALSVLWYLASGTIMLATTGGYVPGRFLGFLVFAVPLAFRVFLYDVPFPALSAIFEEIANLCLIASMALFPFALVPGKKRMNTETDTENNERKR